MRIFLALLTVSLAVTPAERTSAQAPAPLTSGSPALQSSASGSVRSDLMSIEVLPPRAGNEIRTPEGFVRLEGSSAAPAGLATFGTYRPVPVRAPTAGARSAAMAGAQAEAPVGAAQPGGGDGAIPPPPGSLRDPCRAERSRYVRRLLVMSGIDLDDPLALLEGMTGPGGYPAHYLFTVIGLLPGADPIRPLAWDQELRSLARDLAACSRESER